MFRQAGCAFVDPPRIAETKINYIKNGEIQHSLVATFFASSMLIAVSSHFKYKLVFQLFIIRRKRKQIKTQKFEFNSFSPSSIAINFFQRTGVVKASFQRVNVGVVANQSKLE